MTEREPVGTLAEEAARLLAAVHVWAGDPAGSQDSAGGQDSAANHEHRDAEAGECQWCPVCRVVRMAKATRPDVREHLSQAAISLALAVKGLLDERPPSAPSESPLEKIDLTEE